ncbi:MAG: M67 family metallopeptidase [Anaerolineales bacterium]|nr:M67 family metallopeptidase [Anaerolineales bacterium]
MLTIPADVLKLIQAHGEAAYPNEGVGLLLGLAGGSDKTAGAIYPLANSWPADEQFHRYQVDGAAMLQGELEAARRGLDILGFFHSHPDHPAEASSTDHLWATWPWYSYVITTIAQGRATVTRSWVLREDRSAFDEEALTFS